MADRSSPDAFRADPDRLYFAYGSNLHLAQMARRCPSSLYLGRGILHDFQWQINTRGFANVIPHSGSTVHGLVFVLNDTDESRLDRSEGVGKGSYSKACSAVTLHSASESLYRRPVSWIMEMGGAKKILAGDEDRGPSAKLDPFLEEGVLVYLNTKITSEGSPREEYIDRIKLGVEDALVLGVDASALRRSIGPYINDLPLPTTFYPSQSQTADQRVRSLEQSMPPDTVAEMSIVGALTTRDRPSHIEPARRKATSTKPREHTRQELGHTQHTGAGVHKHRLPRPKQRWSWQDSFARSKAFFWWVTGVE